MIEVRAAPGQLKITKRLAADLRQQFVKNSENGFSDSIYELRANKTLENLPESPMQDPIAKLHGKEKRPAA